MIKKAFALASVAALTGFVSALSAAGCTNETPQNASEPPDAAPDVKTGGRPLPSSPDSGDLDPLPESCIATDPIDATKFAYTKALATPGACTTKELGELTKYFTTKAEAKEEISIAKWSAVVSKSCASCVFSDGTGPTWSPILTKGDKIDDLNRGGCIEVLSKKESCGRAYQQATDCRVAACNTSCKTDEEYRTCVGDLQAIFTGTGPCAEAFDAMDTACGDDLGAFETGCQGTDWAFEGPITVQCVGDGSGDAGDGG